MITNTMLLLVAMFYVESDFNHRAVSLDGGSLGGLQIRYPYVVDANEQLGTEYIHTDAYRPEVAVKLFYGYMTRYATKERLGREPTLQDYARIHRGGPDGWIDPWYESYWLKVKKKMRELRQRR